MRPDAPIDLTVDEWLLIREAIESAINNGLFSNREMRALRSIEMKIDSAQVTIHAA